MPFGRSVDTLGHKCNICKSDFTQSGNLTKDMQTHTFIPRKQSFGSSKSMLQINESSNSSDDDIPVPKKKHIPAFQINNKFFLNVKMSTFISFNLFSSFIFFKQF